MRRLLLVPATAMILISTAPALAQPGGGALSNVGPPGGSSEIPKAPARDDPEGAAEDLRLAGKCDEAVPIFRRMSRRAGYAISWYHLGQCLFTLADAEHDAQHAADMRKEGAVWILRAANSGFAQAEAEAVTVCLDGVGIEKDPVEAEKWALVYRHNGLRAVIGLPDVPSDVTTRLDAALNDTTRAEAESRANAWTPAAHPQD